MAKVLQYPVGDPELSDSFAALRRSLDAAVAKSEERAKKLQGIGAPSESITFQVANGLFGQKGYDFRRAFLDLIKQSYGAAFDVNGLSALEAKINVSMVADCAHLEQRDVILHMPKFKLQPPTVSIGRELQSLGMKCAFDLPKGSANFDRLAPRKPNDYLFISDVFHKTYIAVDEKGTAAAAATAVAMMRSTARIEPATPVEVIVDRPFLFAIQHAPTGTCLFLGQVTDPR
jgi:serine protease inhibitor